MTRCEETAVRAEIWQSYVNKYTTDETRKREAELRTGLKRSRTMTFSGVSMRFRIFKKGTPDADGYPLYISLHGGGHNPSGFINNLAYITQFGHYDKSITNGLHVVPRMVRNTWDGHFNPESYPLYDRLIQNMVHFHNADPNRVYLLGYSAGGDGVYAITPRMPDRFAAVNMSAGHHNGINPINLMNTPILLQCGEDDRAFNRHSETPRFGEKLKDLGYKHEVFIHANTGHAFRDNDPLRSKREIWDDASAWLFDQTSKQLKQTAKIINKNTNAVDWLNNYRRDPLPKEIVWDLGTRAHMRGTTSFYWLQAPYDITSGTIRAGYNPKENAVWVTTDGVGGSFSILLNYDMLDLSQAINLIINGKQELRNVTPNAELVRETTDERGDRFMQFSAKLEIFD